MRIVIGEDSALFREGLARLLDDAGHEIVAKAADAPSLEAAVARARSPTWRSSTSACRPTTPTTAPASPVRCGRRTRSWASCCSRSTSRRATPSTS